jgi:hypothetical protein
MQATSDFSEKILVFCALIYVYEFDISGNQI